MYTYDCSFDRLTPEDYSLQKGKEVTPNTININISWWFHS